jgi:glyoxylase I family protein
VSLLALNQEIAQDRPNAWTENDTIARSQAIADGQPGMRPLRLPVMSFTLGGIHHITLRVTDLARSRRFYEGVLGLTVDQDFPPEPGYRGKLRLRLADGTRIVLVPPLPGTPDADQFSEYRIGLDHISLGIPGAHLEDLAAALRTADIPASGVQHDALGPALVCFRDPDNIAWECFQND